MNESINQTDGEEVAGKALRVSAGIAPPSSLRGESVSGRSVATTPSRWPSPRRMPSSTRIRAMRGSKPDAASPFFSFLWRPHPSEKMGKAGRPFRPFQGVWDCPLRRWCGRGFLFVGGTQNEKQSQEQGGKALRLSPSLLGLPLFERRKPASVGTPGLNLMSETTCSQWKV